MRQRREAFLFELGNPRRVLVLGDGDGRFLQVFCALYPEAQIDAVDSSERMIELARDRVGSRVKFHHLDAREFPFDEHYDLAVAHFFFDCFDQQDLAALLARIHAKNWLVSEFQNKRWSRPIVRGLYFFFRWTTGLRVKSLSDHRSVLSQLGYRIQKEQPALGALLVSEQWTVL